MYSSAKKDVCIKKGARALYFIQIFSNLSYCIIYSTLVLYGTEKLKLSPILMTALMGSYVAFNYGLHFLGGYMGGRYISNRWLCVIGIAFQAIACFIISGTSYTTMMIGLSFFLAGSGLNTTCLYSMVTQLFDDPEDPRRERAFLYNYSGMMMGFLFGYTVSGYFQFTHSYGILFFIGGITSSIAVALILVYWRYLYDKGTTFVALSKDKQNKTMLKAYFIIIIILVALIFLLHYSQLSNLILIMCAVSFIIIAFFITIGQKRTKDKKRMFAYLLFLIAAFIFYTIYLLAPMGLTLFIEHNTDLKMFGINIAPQWAGNINAIIITIGGPTLACFLKKMRDKGIKIPAPFLISMSLIFIGLAYVILPVGISFAGKNGLSSFNWVIWCYLFTGVGDLFIAPIGYSMIGKLIPRKLQGMMMGLWLMMAGLGGIMSSYLSKFALGNNDSLDPLVTNMSYSMTFGVIALVALFFGLIMLLFVPKLYRLINDIPKPLKKIRA
jgi:proton-dependent oligopeptide transporter, POT family